MTDNEIMQFSPLGRKIFRVDSIRKDVWVKYGYACLTMAGADGEVAPAEFNYLINEAISLGATSDMIEDWADYEFGKGDLSELLKEIFEEIPANAVRALIYSGIRMSRADGSYHLDEQAAVMRAARCLRVDSHVIASLEALVELEESADRLRAGLLEFAH
jgi:uncharacterized tellurite resistance protein B-like protein